MLKNLLINLNVSIEKLVTAFKDFDEKEDIARFNKACIVAHMHGIDIPSYECEKTVKGKVITYTVKEVKGYDNELSYSEVAKEVGKSKATCVLYGKVIEALIKEGILGSIANGSIPFNMNKLRTIIDNKDKLVDSKHSFEDLTHYSEESIEKMLLEKEGTNDKNDKNEKSNEKTYKAQLIVGKEKFELTLTQSELDNLKKKATLKK